MISFSNRPMFSANKGWDQPPKEKSLVGFFLPAGRLHDAVERPEHRACQLTH